MNGPRIFFSCTLALLLFASMAIGSAKNFELPTKRIHVEPSPQNVTAQALSESVIKISWSYTSRHVGFKIYRATSEHGPYHLAGKTSRHSFTDEGLEENTTYYYKIRAYTPNFKHALGVFSAIVKATTFGQSNGPVCASLLCLITQTQGTTLSAQLVSTSVFDHYTFLNLDNSLVGWWSMDSIENNMIIDHSPNANHGTLRGDATIGDGQFGQSIHPGQGILLNNSRVAITGALTIAAWVNFTGAPEFSYGLFPIIKSGFGEFVGTPYYFAITQRLNLSGVHDVVRLEFRRANDLSLIDERMPAPTLTPHEWHHVALTIMDNGDSDHFVQFYVDGEVIGSTAYPGTPNGVEEGYGAEIGSWTYGSEFFNGQLDELLLFKRDLSAAEIRSLYDARAHPYNNVFSSLASGAHTLQGYLVDQAGGTAQTPVQTVHV